MPDDLDSLLAQAEDQPFSGWDFSWLTGRVTEQPPPWDYTALVAKRARRSPDLLDLGTGGGEWLAGLPSRPPVTVATEGWPPNVAVAAARLRPLGVVVVQVEAAPDNADQASGEPSGRLPFRTSTFHLVTDRHESFVAAEVARVLAPGGRFVTQQVGSGNDDDIYRLLALAPPPPARRWDLGVAVGQVQAVGLEVGGGGAGEGVYWFADVGALVWYLKAIPWTVAGFTPAAHRPRLAALHARIAAEGPLRVRQQRFWLEAVKPTA
jgi:SAM-dependent methyltransferase